MKQGDKVTDRSGMGTIVGQGTNGEWIVEWPAGLRGQVQYDTHSEDQLILISSSTERQPNTAENHQSGDFVTITISREDAEEVAEFLAAPNPECILGRVALAYRTALIADSMDGRTDAR